MQSTDIDNRINYLDFYSQYLKNIRPCGKDKMHTCCPFHEERHPSFWFNTKNGCFKCEGCGESGNAITFLSKIKGIDQKDAYKELLSMAGLSSSTEERTTTKTDATSEYSLEAYAAEKCFSVEWLKDEWSMSNGSDKAGKYIKIPYYGKNGESVATRKRYNPKNPNGRFKWGYGSKLCLYGLDKFADNDNYVILVEGESDTQSLRLLNFNVLGVPGASNFQAAWVKDLNTVKKLYLHIEPDNGGQVFRKQMIQRLFDGKYQGSVYTFTLGAYDVKDPSELYIKHGFNAVQQVSEALESAEKVDLQTEGEDLPELVKGMPVRLKQPDGWQLSDEGIFKYDTRTEQYKRICRTPIIIVKRLRNIETEEEKVQIAFKKGGKWRYGIFPSTTIYQSRSIVQLADLGALITSENSKLVVSFIEALESENIDRIKEARSVSQLGWATEKDFLPIASSDIILDVERTMYGRVNAYTQHGDYEAWKTLMNGHRKRNRFRFIFASAFAAPILKAVNQRIFFVYNWGNSGGGKTAALHAALSVWGNPESLQVSFNATRVGLEQTAAFTKDLPLGLNERQLAGTKQESVEQIVYMLAEGGSKIRGTKNGGLQAMRQWRTVIIANGEEPISIDSTQTGVSTRVIDVYGQPFDSEQEASDIYPFTAENHGHAGAEFIKKMIECGDNTIRALNEKIKNALKESQDGRSGSHVDGIATVATADALASMWVFGESCDTAINEAIAMSKEILQLQPTKEDRDVNKNALQFICDWILSNAQQFENDARGQSFGFISDEANRKFCIYPSILGKALSDMRYSTRKTLKYLGEIGVITKDKDGRNSVVKHDCSKQSKGRFIEFNLSAALSILNGSDEVPDEAQTRFEIPADEDLPF